MSAKTISRFLIVFGIIYFILALNTLFGFLFVEGDPAFSVILAINALVYVFGLFEPRENVNRRGAHLFTGIFFSTILGLFKLLGVASLWFMDFLEGTGNLSMEFINFPVIAGGLLSIALYGAAKKKFTRE